MTDMKQWHRPVIEPPTVEYRDNQPMERPSLYLRSSASRYPPGLGVVGGLCVALGLLVAAMTLAVGGALVVAIIG